MTKPLTFSVDDLRPDMRVSYLIDADHFGVAVITDWHTEPLGFILSDKYNGPAEVNADAILEVLWDDDHDQPFTKWTGGDEHSWVKVVKRPINWDDMGSSARDLWEERATRATSGAKR